MTLFDQPKLPAPVIHHPLFYDLHGPENNKHSEEIYEAQAHRLTNNAKIILLCLQEGQRLTGLDCMKGIRSREMHEPVVMIEYRARFREIAKAIAAGHIQATLETATASNGCKTWWFK